MENQDNRKQMISTVLGCAETIHFAGIGGISMSSLALWARTAGYKVTGSDSTSSERTQMLIGEGIPVKIGHNADNISSADVVVYSVALPSDNPELVSAKYRGIPCLTRAEFLGYMMSFYKARIGVSGTHGKSTTTAMISSIFLLAGADPTVECGAVIPSIKGASRVGGDRGIFIYEACEYRDSFLSFSPTDAVITNIEYDHTDYFPDIDAVVASFAKSIAGADTLYLNVDNEHALKAAQGYGGEIVTISTKGKTAEFGISGLKITKGKPKFTITHYGKPIVKIDLPMIGEFNVANALCAAAVAYKYNIPPSIISSALSSFCGVERRFELKGEFGGIEIYDDYAHHPDEIDATLSTLPSLGYDNIWLVFQPHTYSRTKDLWKGFVEVFKKANSQGINVILADIYAAREKPVAKIRSDLLATACDAKYVGDFDNIAAYIKANAKKGDLVVTMGAGEANKVGDILLGR